MAILLNRPRHVILALKRTLQSSVYLSKIPDSECTEFLKCAQNDVENIIKEIKDNLNVYTPKLRKLLHYPFSTNGKLLRPMLVTLTAATVNAHQASKLIVTKSQNDTANMVSSDQHKIVLITEMIHTASLIHDDVLDSSSIRRGEKSVHKVFGHKEAVLGGDYILTNSSRLLAKINNVDVINVLSCVIEDLIHGEMTQITDMHQNEDKRFHVYLTKTYRKTASLIANSCKAVAMLTEPKLSSDLIDTVYEFGRHIGMAFQLIDDVLDYISSEKEIGKPCNGADLQMGVITGPVLFAAQKYPELNTILSRQFSWDGDKRRALELVQQSDGIGQTRMLAEFHFQAAQRCLSQIRDSSARKALLHVAANFVQRCS